MLLAIPGARAPAAPRRPRPGHRIRGPPRSLPHVESHHQEWLAACKGGPPPLSNFSHSGPAIELLLLGNVASLVRRPLEFDPVACQIVNDPEAHRALRAVRREGWAL